MLLVPLTLLFPASLLETSTSVQDPQAEVQAPAPAPVTWSTSVSSFWIEPPHESGYLSAILYADRGPLHLEAHWAYEGRDTFGIFAGKTLPWEGTIHGSVTPMIGLAAGDTDGVVPALSFELNWESLRFTSASEYLIATSNDSQDFFYSWNELTWTFSERLTVGLVGQRTNDFEQELSVDRGLLVGMTLGKTNLTLYAFNLDRDDPYYSIAFGTGF